ncbi:DUF4214 domain-containing protein [Marinobacter sp. M3C]|uniref:DUF4214 domain-containing protein n=1 Tax=Marinobacter sp. M3C TaxID=2917715 RepID=UPI00201053DF|nr:DUF4214 domain-containing protein [Marinobacter sp. M3C]UQG60150.1 DUF4214 domain-containing protein [Marinobacter sp. M3C]
MATLTVEQQVQQIYIGLLGRAADKAGLDYWTNEITTGVLSIEQLRANIVNEQPEYADGLGLLSRAQVVSELYQNLFERAAESAGLNYWVSGEGSSVNIDQLVLALTNAAGANDRLALDNKTEAATYYAANVGTGFTRDGAKAAVDSVDGTRASVLDSKAATDGGTQSSGDTFTLTQGADSFSGGASNDTFNGADNANGAVWTTGDSLNGGAGEDTFNIVTGTAITGAPVGATVANVENINVTSDAAVTLNTTSFSGLTSLSVNNDSAQILTAAATTDVAATADAATVTVNGGKDVTVTSTDNVLDNISVGGTTAAAGTVDVNVTGGDAGTETSGSVNVTGGSTVNVTQNAGNAAATGNDTVGGVIGVTGDANTTAVTVNQTDTGTGLTATSTAAGVVGFTAGSVTINDANQASATAAGTIATVSLDSYGNSTIDSGALTTVNLEGTGGSLGVTAGALTTAVVDTLALNVSGLTAGATTLDADYTTVNIDSSTAASTVSDLIASSATTVNVAGDAKLTLTDQDFTGADTITVTNTAGASFGATAIAATTAFTGGAGADAVVLSNAMETAVDMGAGDDSVTYGGATSTVAGKVGSVNAGDGKDTIVMTATLAAAADDNAAFNTAFTGFEVLDLTTVGSETVNLVGINGVNEVVTRGATSLTLNGYTSGGKLTLDAASTAVAANVTNAVLTAGDVFNVDLSNSTNNVVGFGTVTLAGIETVNLSTVDAGTDGDAAATIDTATLVATDATSVTVAGNNGLDLTNTGNTAITSFDASGVVADSAATVDTAANLAVTFASANTTAAATVSITGGAGNDTLTGNAAKDTISGGAGNDTITGGTGQDSLSGGAGRDAFAFVSDATTATPINDSSTAGADVVTDFGLTSVAVAGATVVGAAAFQAASAGGAGADILSFNMSDNLSADVTVAAEANGTGAGQGVGVTYTVANGILTVSGTGASGVDTLAEWLSEAAAVAADDGELLAFEFGGDTYVFGQNGAVDSLVELSDVTGATGLVDITGAITADVGSIMFENVV